MNPPLNRVTSSILVLVMPLLIKQHTIQQKGTIERFPQEIAMLKLLTIRQCKRIQDEARIKRNGTKCLNFAK